MLEKTSKIPRNKFEAYKEHVTYLKSLEHGKYADNAVHVYGDKIVMCLENYLYGRDT